MNLLKGKGSITTLVIVITAALCGCSSNSGDGVTTPPPPATNNAPTISGTPGTTIMVGNAYSFTPNASDADGDSLTYSIQNKPMWADYSGTTGALTGVPSPGDVGIYSNIAISVSDGALSNNLPQFAVNVLQNAGGSITLSWTAPTQNDDGSTPVDLDAYKFYYGTSTGVYANQILVENPGITTFVIENLDPATYYFVVTAINGTGGESVFSNAASKQIL